MTCGSYKALVVGLEISKNIFINHQTQTKNRQSYSQQDQFKANTSGPLRDGDKRLGPELPRSPPGPLCTWAWVLKIIQTIQKLWKEFVGKAEL